MGRLFALAEAYPDLKTSQNFQELQKSLVEIENNVQYARRYYNAVIRDLNTLVQSFPSILVASAMEFGERLYFQLDDSERAAPRVSFGGNAEVGAPASPRPARTQVRVPDLAQGRNGSCHGIAPGSFSRDCSGSCFWA